jgi:hypothetical protein
VKALVQREDSKNLPVEPEPSRRFNLLFTVEGFGIQGTRVIIPPEYPEAADVMTKGLFTWR